MTAPHRSPVQAVPHATLAGLSGIEVAPENANALNEYLAVYIDPATDDGRCPCGAGWFTWSDVWGAGCCSECQWPGRLYHAVLDRREDAEIVCHATVNGYRVCEARRGEHKEHEVRWYPVGGGEPSIEIELRCPNPTTPSGLSDLAFGSRFKPPAIARFNLLLWVHPDFVAPRAAA